MNRFYVTTNMMTDMHMRFCCMRMAFCVLMTGMFSVSKVKLCAA